MKLGVFNDDLHTDFAAAARLAAEAGVDGLAVRAVGGCNIANLEEADVRELRRHADAHNVEIVSIGSQFGRGLYLDDDQAKAEATAHLDRALRYAEICGTQLVRAFAGWLVGQEPLSEWRRRPPYPECLARLAEVLRPYIRAAERAGMKLMFELEGASYVGTVAEMRAFSDTVGSASVVLCWDVCNAWWSGERPRAGLDALGDVPLVDVQTKDVPALPDRPQIASFGRAVVGQGDVGYGWLLPALAARDYRGYVTAERVHHPLKPEDNPAAQNATLADIAALKSILGRT